MLKQPCEFKCSKNGVCIDLSKVCDQQNDCEDGQDEVKLKLFYEKKRKAKLIFNLLNFSKIVLIKPKLNVANMRSFAKLTILVFQTDINVMEKVDETGVA